MTTLNNYKRTLAKDSDMTLSKVTEIIDAYNKHIGEHPEIVPRDVRNKISSHKKKGCGSKKNKYTGYNLYMKENSKTATNEDGTPIELAKDRFRAVSKMWGGLSQDEKEKYKEKAKKVNLELNAIADKVVADKVVADKVVAEKVVAEKVVDEKEVADKTEEKSAVVKKKTRKKKTKTK